MVVPNSPEYGPLAGKILSGAEEQGLLYCFDSTGSVTTLNVGVAIEDIDLIRPGEEFFLALISEQVGIVGASATEFVPYVNKILLTQETHSGSGLFVLGWNGSEFTTEQLVDLSGANCWGMGACNFCSCWNR
ncbi:MAG: hypothetical protein R3C03_17695 [Pirellulaceae bacterium]